MSILDRSESRRGYTVRVLAVHTTEGGGTPQALRDADWWTGSSHAIADEGTLLTPEQGMVPYSRAAWTLRSGNYWSENIELIGFADWSRDEWLSRPGLLENCARWLADRAKANGIPLSKISAAEYRAGGWGVIGHVDHTVGYSDGTHYDPGPNFPYDVVIARARDIQNGDDMPSADEVADALLNRVVTMPDKSKASVRTIIAAIRQSQKSQQADLDDIQTRLGAIEAKLNAPAEPPAA
jgi:hypothetical protein